ncbi:MAG: ribosome maturation factor RimP [Clostridia bacterium]|nr:ribosome maturation factor RimP [Clostridia bacterium]
MSKVIDLVTEHITKAVEDLGFEIVEITYKKYLGDMNLTIFIDSDNGVDLNACELVHRTIDPILDEIDPTSGERYILNVSSSGIDRPLKTERDYRKNTDKEVNISLFEKVDNLKKFVGILRGYDLEKGVVTIELDNKEINLDIKNIALIKPEIKF